MFKKAIVVILACAMFMSGCNSGKKVDTADSSQTQSVSSDLQSSDNGTSEPIFDETDNPAENIVEEDADPNVIGDSIFDMDFDFSEEDLNFDLDEDDEASLSGPDLRPSGNTAVLLKDLKGGADAEAQALRKRILKNTNDIKPKDSKYTFYVSEKNGNDKNDGTSPQSAWKTPDAILFNSYQLDYGVTLLFERGGYYRVSASIPLKSGVSYGAYGKGDKPVLTASLKNYANELIWKPSRKKYIWMCEIKYNIDIGNIVFNHGQATGIKQTKLANLTKNYQFFSDEGNGTLYLYLNTGNPGVKFKSIDLCPKVHIMSGKGKITNVTVDNLCMRYSGSFGVSVNGTAQDIKVTNCEIGWIGGSFINTSGGRYGNGIEFYGNAINCLVQNNWLYQIYDSALTHQGQEAVMKNITFNNNLIEYCTWSIEAWNTDEDGNDSEDDNFEVYEDLFYTNNIMRFAGLGWAQQRAVNEYDSHINCWNNYQKTLKNMQITGNIFDVAAVNLIHWRAGREQGGVTVKGNSYYQNYPGVAKWENLSLTANSQATLEDAIQAIDSAPKTVKWIG